MDLLTPEIGLLFWNTISFLILLFLLGKFAWKPVMKAIGERERSIEDALDAAEKAKAEMSRLTSENEQLLKKAREERDLILKEAKQIKDQMLKDAKDLAQKEGARLIENAKLEINNQKAIAISEVKDQVSTLSIAIARKILESELSDQVKQEVLVDKLLKEVKLN
ncbi:F0F1 ATP synthase subunit B [Olivibacter sitiensis]|uniref:F0F1 ATP synthase subunit B n=1 Tax=Olivibacter sitiensis TaxID=376470 RepID=UPI0003FB8759|nr:F0F1 ATP synthase subunit B [Olivibacter sitiensis]